MKDYLWDRSGEPDKDIQKLEEILGPMGYQPRPLEIPATIQPGRRLNLYPALAIAAAVALVALALGIWLTINRDPAVAPVQAGLTPVPVENNNKGPQPVSSPDETINTPATAPNQKPRQVLAGNRSAGRNQLALHERGNRKSSQPQPVMTAAAVREAEAGKEQLMVALRLASVKLNHAVKRAQGGYPGNLIRNQHKVG